MIDYRKVKYLDPKNDLTFRKIFGQHPNIMKSFLNSVLPFSEDRYIEELIYQDPAMLPEIPEMKHTVVDVKCIDNYGRQFIVEMQMYWTNSFKSRMLFNSGKAYVKQLDKGKKYSDLNPVYGLSLVNDIFLVGKEYEDKYYHHYKLAHHDIPNEDIEGIELVFIELPKFKAKSFTEKRMRNLWLRFLTEIDEQTIAIDNDLATNNDIKNALEQLHISAFNPDELEYYDNYWDKVRLERASIEDAIEKMKIAKEEAGKAKEEAGKAKEEAGKAKEEAGKAKEEAGKAKKEADKAKEEADKAKEEADKAKEEADKAKEEADKAKGELKEINKKIEKSVFKLKKMKLSEEDIAKALSITQQEVNNILDIKKV